ncbi:metallophosphoesterase family protein [filamentous cyanobacterium LEGE 11480]|uniref:Metallophosphoesterase family protein n=1 Tax=Romeriopsis navalis LEGE 11480 TaxID=2777977 RepID=A0A928Z332_9CYAN|nr:metallophosphoesterase family protein [Romeriopsis navalis]MBE9028925.1 metallophosphoesterase family protein [Romeriopsis navalis LEGE 11480]
MKIAVMSCIHGNYEALNEVLCDIDAQQVEQIFCLGDLVGYGPHPNAVVEMIRSLDIPTVQGCWDEDIVDGLNACECSYPSLIAERRGKAAHVWTDQALHPENREFLAQLPLTLRHDNLCFVHGSPHNQHEYLMPEMDAFAAMERVMATEADVLFCGHTHIPYVRQFDQGQFTVKVNSVTVKSNQKAKQKTITQEFTTSLKKIVNAGSVGEPRHGRPNATYVIYETETQNVTLREVEYDYQKTCAAIIEKGLPEIFAWRLARGWEYAERADDPSHICER